MRHVFTKDDDGYSRGASALKKLNAAHVPRFIQTASINRSLGYATNLLLGKALPLDG